MFANAEAEHHWLQKLVGEWTYDGECDTGPDKPSEKFEGGTESVKMIGDLWVVGEGRGKMPGGGDATTMITLGYDSHTKRFVGTWIGSMMTKLWVYDGSLDAAQKVLTLESDGPSMKNDGLMAKYRDVIEFKSDDHRILTSHVMGDDGHWKQFMIAHYRRTA
ncbi:MAG: DUF1579 domain-containing protein [Planctomycetota bacterium]|nr:DUF1579 domain-containing protein [Planctomycetaceae bacterium]MDQ3332480.1 DUF1579 domain-containing protein [Planctomycetota bacterium]